jgi:hypothetical protein
MPIVRYAQKFSKRLDLPDSILLDESQSLNLCPDRRDIFCKDPPPVSITFSRLSNSLGSIKPRNLNMERLEVQTGFIPAARISFSLEALV